MEYNVYCSLCRKIMEEGYAAYGMTHGCIDGEVEGFRMSIDDEWDVYCPDCMNTIDRLIADYRSKKMT